MPYRGAERGEPSAHLPPSAFVAFIQNHDQVGNRAFGERLSAIADPAALRAVTALYLLLPQIPMLFMGEEWHSRRPFQFFCDFERRARRRGAQRPPPGIRALRGVSRSGPRASGFRIRRPSRPSRTASSTGSGWPTRRMPRRCAGIATCWPRAGGTSCRCCLRSPRPVNSASWTIGALVVCWRASGGAELTLMANLSARATPGFPAERGCLLWQEGRAGADGTFSPWSLRWSLRA